MVVAVLTHLFYPRSSNRWYFLNPTDNFDDETTGDELGQLNIDSTCSENEFKVNGHMKNGYSKLPVSEDNIIELTATVDVTMDNLDGVFQVVDKTKN